MDPDPSPSLRSETARTTVKVAGFLVVLKTLTWLWTDSSGVLGSALDSLLDVAASLLVLWALIVAEKPADADHPWGHGKAEGLAALFQSLLILGAGGGLLLESWDRFRDPEARLELPGLGVATMAVSTGVTIWWVRRLRRVARETGSPALAADSAHYASDVLMHLSVAAGLLLSALLGGKRWPDFVVGAGIGFLIISTGVQVLRQAFHVLMDRGLEPEEDRRILCTLLAFEEQGVRGFHGLRARRSGAELFLELHLDMDRDLSFVAAHRVAERAADALEEALPRSRVTIHADPL